MAVEMKEMEIERLMNLARNFGWEKIEEKTQGGNLLITLQKKLFSDEELVGTGGAG